MVGHNLPPDVTPGDIDEAFGAPEKRSATVEFTLDVTAQAEELPDDALIVSASGGRAEAEVVHTECVDRLSEVSLFVVYVSLQFETTRRDESDVVSEAKGKLSVSARDLVREKQIVDAEVIV